MSRVLAPAQRTLLHPRRRSTARYGRRACPTRGQRDHVNLADIYLRDPQYVNEVLAQARATAFGLRNVQFLTSAGIRILLDQAAGIVIDLLIALSIIALITAGVLLAASARAEVQRRLGAIGVRRAVGETRGQVALAQGLEGLLVAVPFGSLGIASRRALDRLTRFATADPAQRARHRPRR